MATSKSSDKTPKLMDVAHPGKSIPPASGRPIIVTNRSILRKDPMVVSADGIEKDASSPDTLRAPKPITVIKPLDGDEKVADNAAPAPSKPSLPPKPDTDDISISEDAAPDKDVAAKELGGEALESTGVAEPESAEPESAQPAEVTSEEPEKPDESPEQTAEAAPVEPPKPEEPADEDDEDESDSQLAPNQALEETKRKEEEAKAAFLAEEEKIVASKQFYLPISASNQRRGVNRALLILALVLVSVFVWADIVLDAGIVHIGTLRAVTHFFVQ